MVDRSVSVGVFATAVAWTLVFLVFGAVWATWIAGARQVTYILGLTLIPLTAIAAVMHLRLGQMRLCAVVRAATGLSPAPERELHSLP